jgi:uncharacterized membrane protein YdbT with pleckstrin-like domain
MGNELPIGKQALRYRLVINETIGIVITIALTAFVAILLYVIKVKNATVIDSIIFLCVFVVQFVILYLFSLLQYKNLKYAIGQNSISFQRGTFGVERETIPFEKIKNSTFDQSFIQRLFSVGDITIEQDDEKYVWENIDSATASKISNTVSAKGDVQPITVATANAVVNATQPATSAPTSTNTNQN